ncbi:MAG: L,D-transpeptidase family protein [Candidatus Latescibacteria bacterium]|nr:L,D-transpeptidase family protein [Candidatus Latescibacterota bacterium]
MARKTNLLVLLATLASASVLCAEDEAGGGRIAARLRQRLEAIPPESAQPALSALGEPLHRGDLVVRFYQGRDYAPAWSGDRGPLALADSLTAALAGLGADGLQTRDYHPDALAQGLARLNDRRWWRTRPDPDDLAEFDLLATDAYLLAASQCLGGRLDPRAFDPDWIAERRTADVVAVLSGALAAGEIGGSLQRLLPAYPDYARLRHAFAQYRALATLGAWPTVPAGDKLEPGDRDARVPLLRAHLAATGDLGPGDALGLDPEYYDQGLAAAVRRFQARFGLDRDGVIGQATQAELGASVEDRIRQIRVNLERWRWLPANLGHRRVQVNIPDYRLEVFHGDTVVLAMPVIVGLPTRRTPVFSAKLNSLVFSPDWEVPPKLAIEDKLPLIQQDPGYLQEFGFEVIAGWGEKAKVVDPRDVAWENVPAGSFPYRLRQMPGPLNALGLVKFNLPNRFNVYLHDTPNRGLFARAKRAFSAGCVRIQKPEEFAAYLLTGDERWPRWRIAEAMGSGREQAVRVPAPIPIHLLYWTAWVDRQGTVVFRPDIYQIDNLTAVALEAPYQWVVELKPPPDNTLPKDVIAVP